MIMILVTSFTNYAWAYYFQWHNMKSLLFCNIPVTYIHSTLLSVTYINGYTTHGGIVIIFFNLFYFLWYCDKFTTHVWQIWTNRVFLRDAVHSYICTIYIMYLCKHPLHFKNYLNCICSSDGLSLSCKEEMLLNYFTASLVIDTWVLDSLW